MEPPAPQPSDSAGYSIPTSSNSYGGTIPPTAMLIILGPASLCIACILLTTISKSLARLHNRSLPPLLPPSSPATHDSILKTLPPVSPYRSANDVFQHTECVVCLNGFEENDSVRILPLCRHAFHVDCVDKWLLSHSSCPVCRLDVVARKRGPVKLTTTAQQGGGGGGGGEESEPVGEAGVPALGSLYREPTGRWRDERYDNLLGSLRRSLSTGSVVGIADEEAGYGDGGQLLIEEGRPRSSRSSNDSREVDVRRSTAIRSTSSPRYFRIL